MFTLLKFNPNSLKDRNVSNALISALCILVEHKTNLTLKGVRDASANVLKEQLGEMLSESKIKDTVDYYVGQSELAEYNLHAVYKALSGYAGEGDVYALSCYQSKENCDLLIALKMACSKMTMSFLRDNYQLLVDHMFDNYHSSLLGFLFTRYPNSSVSVGVATYLYRNLPKFIEEVFADKMDASYSVAVTLTEEQYEAANLALTTGGNGNGGYIVDRTVEFEDGVSAKIMIKECENGDVARGSVCYYEKDSVSPSESLSIFAGIDERYCGERQVEDATRSYIINM